MFYTVNCLYLINWSKYNRNNFNKTITEVEKELEKKVLIPPVKKGRQPQPPPPQPQPVKIDSPEMMDGRNSAGNAL